MKRFSLMLMLAIMMVSSAVFAGSVDYLVNQSAKFVMTFSRNASTEASADLANYNPAGTAFLAPGLYLDLSNQFLFKPYKQDYTVNTVHALPTMSATYADESVEQSEPTLLLPNLYAVYNFGEMGPGKLAAYLHAGITAGGGTLKWDDGTAGTFMAGAGIYSTLVSQRYKGAGTLGLAGFGAAAAFVQGQLGGGPEKSTSSIEATSVYYGINVGVAYSFLDDMMSASVGGRVLMPKREIKVAVDYPNIGGSADIEYDATGFAPIIGFDLKPLKELVVSLRYEFETELEFEYTIKERSSNANTINLGSGPIDGKYLVHNVLTKIGYEDGMKMNYNLPAVFAFGAEYQVMPELAVMVSLNMYFLSQADMGKVTNSVTGKSKDTADYFGTGWEASIGAKYKVLPELTVGAGFIYTYMGAKDEYFEDLGPILNCSSNPPLDSYTIGLGVTYDVMPGLDVTLAGSWTHYLPKSYEFVASPAEDINPTAPGTAFSPETVIKGEYKKDVYNIALGVSYKAF